MILFKFFSKISILEIISQKLIHRLWIKLLIILFEFFYVIITIF